MYLDDGDYTLLNPRLRFSKRVMYSMCF